VLIVIYLRDPERYGYHPWNVAPSPIKAPIGWFTPRELPAKGGGWVSYRSLLCTHFSTPVGCRHLECESLCNEVLWCDW
jgi:hypothetical protein